MTLSRRVFGFPAFARQDTERKATWMELFFDLAFVVVIASTAHALSGATLPRGVVEFAVLFTLLFTAWAGYTFYNDRFDTDHLAQRLLALLQMVLVMIIAILHDWLGEDFALFVGVYLLLRGITIFGYLVAGRYVAEARRVTRSYVAGFSLALIPLIAALGFEDRDTRLALAGLTMLLQLIPPALPHRGLQGLPLSHSHAAERLGLFVTLALGELLVGITAVGAEQPGLSIVPGGALAVFITFGFWSVYFSQLDGAVLRQSAMRSTAWVYLHIPLTMFIVAMAVGIEETLAEVLHAGGEFPRLLAFSWGGGMLCLAAMNALRPPSQSRRKIYPLTLTAATAAAAIIALPLVTNDTGAFTVLLLIGGFSVPLLLLASFARSQEPIQAVVTHHVGMVEESAQPNKSF